MNKPPVIPLLTRAELHELTRAKTLLENPGFTIRLANRLGAPVEKGFALLPKGWTDTVNRAAKLSLLKALEVAMLTLNNRGRRNSKEFFHKVLVGTSGGIGGAFGLAALPVELPLSTTIMLRSIADIARSEGHDLRLMTTKLSCLEVFALGGTRGTDDAAESAYWMTRTALSKSVSEAASYLAEKGVLDTTAPAIIRLINNLASRFGVIVSEEAAAKAVPILGAAGGSAINVLFMKHFQEMARGHFIVMRLEDKHGFEMIRDAYQALPDTSARITPSHNGGRPS